MLSKNYNGIANRCEIIKLCRVNAYRTVTINNATVATTWGGGSRESVASSYVKFNEIALLKYVSIKGYAINFLKKRKSRKLSPFSTQYRSREGINNYICYIFVPLLFTTNNFCVPGILEHPQ